MIRFDAMARAHVYVCRGGANARDRVFDRVEAGLGKKLGTGATRGETTLADARGRVGAWGRCDRWIHDTGHAVVSWSSRETSVSASTAASAASACARMEKLTWCKTAAPNRLNPPLARTDADLTSAAKSLWAR